MLPAEVESSGLSVMAQCIPPPHIQARTCARVDCASLHEVTGRSLTTSVLLTTRMVAKRAPREQASLQRSRTTARSLSCRCAGAPRAWDLACDRFRRRRGSCRDSPAAVASCLAHASIRGQGQSVEVRPSWAMSGSTVTVTAASNVDVISMPSCSAML